MAERVKYARQASARVSSYALDSDGDSEDTDEGMLTDADAAVQGLKGRHKASKARRQSKHRRAANDEEDDADARDEFDSAPKKQRKKRAKKGRSSSKTKEKSTAQRKGKKKSGKLEAIQRLPLELLGEIASHVGPNTLLSLRLVNKHFHDFLSTKSSESIWKAARLHAKLPDIEGLTEMQYAELIFGKTCQGCYGNKVGRIYHDFFFRKNLCKRCRHFKIIDVSKLAQEDPELHASLHPAAAQCVMRTRHHAYIDDLSVYDVILRNLDAQEDDSHVGIKRQRKEASPDMVPQGSRRSFKRPQRSTAASFRSYKDESESESEDEEKPVLSRRVLEYVKKRRSAMHKIRPVSTLITA
ncbi:hypothetical protein JCM10908_006222 [Rhodotorula pacifica]|uniref:uncharacterized protein n=1 Tax=Rhodotorula pacifica TaxID=1495444 RepID=UPI00317A1700